MCTKSDAHKIVEQYLLLLAHEIKKYKKHKAVDML